MWRLRWGGENVGVDVCAKMSVRTSVMYVGQSENDCEWMRVNHVKCGREGVCGDNDNSQTNPSYQRVSRSFLGTFQEGFLDLDLFLLRCLFWAMREPTATRERGA